MAQTKLELMPYYDADALRESMVRPGLVFKVSYYFIDYWLPLLGPGLAWLVVALQQACWQGNQQTDRCKISQQKLADLIGVTRTTVNVHYLKDKLIRYFVRPESCLISGRRRDTSLYYVRLNTPLTPAHAAGLKIYLDRRQPAALPQVISELLALEPVKLLTLFQELGQAEPIPPAPLRVVGILEACFPGQAVSPWAEVLREHVTRAGAGYVGTQYFRKNWVPILGAGRAWLVTVIRRHGYYRPQTGQCRNTFSFEKSDLKDKIGISPQTLRRLLAPDTLLSCFLPALYLTRHHVTGQILLEREPLTPADQVRFDEQLINVGVRPEPDFSASQKLTEAPAETDQNLTGSIGPTNQNLTLLSPTTGQNLTRFMTERSQPDQHQNCPDHLGPARPAEGDDEVSLAEILALLDQIHIHSPKREKLARLAVVRRPNYLSGWLNWFSKQNKLGLGWLIVQIESGRDPPVETLLSPLPQRSSGRGLTADEKRWQETLEILKGQMTRQTFNSTLRDSCLICFEKKRLSIQVGSALAKALLENRLYQVVGRAISQIWGAGYEVRYVHSQERAED